MPMMEHVYVQQCKLYQMPFFTFNKAGLEDNFLFLLSEHDNVIFGMELLNTGKPTNYSTVFFHSGLTWGIICSLLTHAPLKWTEATRVLYCACAGELPGELRPYLKFIHKFHIKQKLPFYSGPFHSCHFHKLWVCVVICWVGSYELRMKQHLQT